MTEACPSGRASPDRHPTITFCADTFLWLREGPLVSAAVTRADRCDEPGSAWPGGVGDVCRLAPDHAVGGDQSSRRRCRRRFPSHRAAVVRRRGRWCFSERFVGFAAVLSHLCIVLACSNHDSTLTWFGVVVLLTAYIRCLTVPVLLRHSSVLVLFPPG